MTTQQALAIVEVGKPLAEITRPVPTPNESQILVKVLVCGILPVVQKQRDDGLLVQSPPDLPIGDPAGLVVGVGSKVTKFKKGDMVFGQVSMMDNDARASQEFVILDDWATSLVPKGLNADEASTLISNLMTPAVAFYTKSGFGWPRPGSPESKTFDYGARSLAIAGANSDCGRFAIQIAKQVGIKNIVAIASASSAATLKSLGATHVIDRRSPIGEIKQHTQAAAGPSGVSYVFNAVDRNLEIAVAALTNQEKGIIVTIVHSYPVDEKKVGRKADTYEVKMIRGSGHMHRAEIGEWFWENILNFVSNGGVKPTSYKVIPGGLNADGLNKLLDDYRDDKNPGRHHLHPNGDF